MSNVVAFQMLEVAPILRRLLATAAAMTALLTAGQQYCLAQASALQVYVAPFQSDQVLSAELLRKVTEDFDEFLTNSGQYRVLERRHFGDLQVQLHNEAEIQGNPALGRAFRARGAQAIFFGKVEHDSDDLSYVFSATLITLSGERLWTRSSSVKQTLVGDRESRRTAIRKLIPESVGTTTVPQVSQPRGDGPSQPTLARGQLGDNPSQLRSCIRPPQGLVGWWTGDLDEKDSVHGNDATSALGVTHVLGMVQNGFQFSNRGFMEIPASPFLANQRFTWLAWVRPDGPGPNNDEFGSGILGQNIDNYHDSIFLGWSAKNNQFKLYFASGEIASRDRFPPGRFYLVAGTYDGRSFRLYVDGASQGYLSRTDAIVYSAQPWAIGGAGDRLARQGYPRTLNGVIDEVQAFNRALDELEIKSIFAAGHSGECKFVRYSY